MVRMRIPRSLGWLGWVVIGAVIGGLATNFTAMAIAQQPAQQPRLRFMSSGSSVPTGRGTLHFISDAKSGGCWLASLDLDGNLTSLATAPTDACK